MSVSAIHFVGTFVIVGLHFLTGMASFTEDVSEEIEFWRLAQWIWTPLAMAAWDPEGVHREDHFIGLAFLWSCFIGLFAGFLVPLINAAKSRRSKLAVAK